jgi:hypothetical protein
MLTLNRKTENNLNNALLFSIIGSLLMISLFVFINYSTKCSFPWFIYPTFAVLWWPLSIACVRRHAMKGFSVFGSLAIIAILFLTNYLTSWEHLWFIYPSFAVLWWPLAMLLHKKYGKALSVIGSLSIIAFSIAANYIACPSYIWFYYPAFAVIWWPLSVFFAHPRTAKVYSVLGALSLLALFAIDSRINSPACPWVLFTVYPVLLWPICVFLGKRTLGLTAAMILSTLGIAYYAALNLLLFQGFPWAIFPAYCLLWWPLATAFKGSGHAMLFSLSAALLSAVFFAVTNAVTSPNVIWAVYPIFLIIWWPLSIYYFVYKPRLLREKPGKG